jgi:hypothetical protein
MPLSRYDYLNRKTIVVHDEQRRELSEAALTELEQFQAFEFYNQEKMLRISQANRTIRIQSKQRWTQHLP